MYRASASRFLESRLSIQQLRSLYDEWMLDSQIKQFTDHTLAKRKDVVAKFFWFLEQRNFVEVGAIEIKAFLAYLGTGHKDSQGRWGNPRLTKPMRPVSMNSYYRVLHAFFNWMVEEEIVEVTLMQRVKSPIYRSEVKQPIPTTVVNSLLEAAKRSHTPERNVAIILVLLDTGIRAAELCNLKVGDVDIMQRSFRVLGKGNKFRTCYIGQTTTKALMRYMRLHPKKSDAPLFQASSRRFAGTCLTTSGLAQIPKRLAKDAGVPENGPHALRRTFAVEFLRASNGNVFTCQHLLGHTDLTQTRLYCAVAQADVENQHRQFSPADRLKGK